MHVNLHSPECASPSLEVADNQHLGIIPQRLPSLNYRASEFADKGYAITDIDALTGARRFHNVRFDDSGQVFNLDPNSIALELRAMLSISGATGYSPLNIASEMIAACGRDTEGRGRCSSKAMSIGGSRGLGSGSII